MVAGVDRMPFTDRMAQCIHCGTTWCVTDWPRCTTCYPPADDEQTTCGGWLAGRTVNVPQGKRLRR